LGLLPEGQNAYVKGADMDGDRPLLTGIFWAVATGITFFVALILGKALRGPDTTALPEVREFDRNVYRDQLREIERDTARGLVSDEETQRLRAEVARRLLDADRAAPAPVSAGVGPVGMGIALALLLLAGAFGLYAKIGTPAALDQPLAQRIALAEERRAALPSQMQMEAESPATPALETADPGFLTLMTQLRTKMVDRPDDLIGQQLLARNEARLANFVAAYKAQEAVIRLKGTEATADDHVVAATLMIQAAGGRVSREAETALTAALRLNDTNDSAMFFLGILNLQVGREDLAFRYWRKLIEVAPIESPWVDEVRPRMTELAEIAGVPYRLPEAQVRPSTLAGPTPEMMEEAAKMPAADQQEMIRGMVEQLNDRLATTGGSAEEWGRLILAFSTLGEADRARTILTEARSVFAGRTAEIEMINQAAASAGLDP
jgi:cytochrome c-type biogenesis protein CcmH